MKYLVFPLLLLTIACGKTVNGYGDLSEEEKSYLQNLGRIQCMENTRAQFDGFERSSNNFFNELDRGDLYLHEFKQGDTKLKSAEIQVWKNDGSNLYLILTNEVNGSGVSYQFVKITRTTNSEMIDELQRRRCTRSENITASSSSSNMTYKVVSAVNGARRTKKTTTKTNTADFNSLPFFANYKFDQTVKTTMRDDSPTDPATADEVTKGTVTFKEEGADLASNSYTGYSGAEFCIVDFVDGSASGTPNSYAFPFNLNCSPSTAQFNPAAEL